MTSPTCSPNGRLARKARTATACRSRRFSENDWSLAAGRYKPVTTEAVNHDAPAEILGDVLKIENEIIRRGNALLTQLSTKQ